MACALDESLGLDIDVGPWNELGVTSFAGLCERLEAAPDELTLRCDGHEGDIVITKNSADEASFDLLPSTFEVDVFSSIAGLTPSSDRVILRTVDGGELLYAYERSVEVLSDESLESGKFAPLEFEASVDTACTELFPVPPCDLCNLVRLEVTSSTGSLDVHQGQRVVTRDGWTLFLGPAFVCSGSCATETSPRIAIVHESILAGGV